MSETLKRNFEPGRLLLVATLLMSLTLISQLYVISESIDLSNGLQFTGVEISLAASYFFTAFSMVIVINEFFQVKLKIKGLLDLSNLLVNNNSRQVNVQPIFDLPIIEETPIDGLLEDEELLEELDELDEESEFDKLLEEEFEEEKPVDDALSKYKTTKIKVADTGEIEPLIEEGELKNIFDQLEEETEMDRMLAESEVIQTLSELEGIVKELKIRKAPAAQK
ncbi:MAG: hypothetical protein NWF07_10780 [Candidatus Bathyarchaeota archaeon]|nr:hypothetical protein [Candidatus Bathyarchaeota archaeon]